MKKIVRVSMFAMAVLTATQGINGTPVNRVDAADGIVGSIVQDAPRCPYPLNTCEITSDNNPD